MELSGPMIKKFLVFFIFQEIELSGHKIKNLTEFSCPKIKKFQEGTFRARKIKNPL